VTETNKGGRPRKSEDDKRQLQRVVRFTPAEIAMIDSARGSTPLARYMREAALERARAQRP